MDLTGFAKVLGGARRLEGSEASRPTNVSRVSGTAVSDSSDGRVLVRLDAQVFSGDGSQYVELPTSGNVREGDSLYVDLVGSDGKGKTMMVVGTPGGGDRQQGEIDAAAEVANATAQHFWADDNGAHVSTEAGVAEGTQNALWNSLGMLFRKGANNLLALVTGSSPGMLIYDGGGNADSNVIASFVGNLIELGKNSAESVIRMCDGAGTFLVSTYGFTMTVGEPSQTSPMVRLKKYDSGSGHPEYDGGYVEIVLDRAVDDGTTQTPGDVEASIRMENSPSNDSRIDLSANVLRADDAGSAGALKPIGLYRVTMTTPANNGADATVTINGTGDNDIVVTDTNYCVFIQPEGQPNGFTHISYVVSDKYLNAFRIHAYNDYSQAITQTLDVMVVHL